MSKLTLYAEPCWYSPYVFSAYVALREKQLPFELVMIDLDGGGQHAPSYTEKSLTSRVPCLAHGDFFLSESSAIVEYLEELFAPPIHAPLFPSAARERARVRQLQAFIRSDLGPLREERSTETMFFKRAEQPLSTAARASADKLVRFAEALLPAGADHLFGDWSLADAELAFILQRLIINRDALPARLENYARKQWQRATVVEYVGHARPERS